MFELVTVLFSAAVGILPPLVRLAVRDLIKLPAFGSAFDTKIGKLLLRAFDVTQPYAEMSKPEELFSDLAIASTKLDGVVHKIEEFSKERKEAIARYEGTLQSLSAQERELKSKVDELQHVSLPAVELFNKLIEARDKKSAYRDYFLFLAGVVVSAIVAILLKRFGYV